MDSEAIGEPRDDMGAALGFWEPARLPYNGILVTVVAAGTTLVPDTGFIARHGLGLVVLVLGANVLYCAAYLVELAARRSTLARAWERRGRLILWLAGTFAVATLAFTLTLAMFDPSGPIPSLR